MEWLRLKLFEDNITTLTQLKHHLPYNERLRAGWLLKQHPKILYEEYFNEVSVLASTAKERDHSKQFVGEHLCPITTCPKCKAPIRWLQGRRKKVPIEAKPYGGEQVFDRRHHVCHLTICSMFGD